MFIMYKYGLPQRGSPICSRCLLPSAADHLCHLPQMSNLISGRWEKTSRADVGADVPEIAKPTLSTCQNRFPAAYFFR